MRSTNHKLSESRVPNELFLCLSTGIANDAPYACLASD